MRLSPQKAESEDGGSNNDQCARPGLGNKETQVVQ